MVCTISALPEASPTPPLLRVGRSKILRWCINCITHEKKQLLQTLTTIPWAQEHNDATWSYRQRSKTPGAMYRYSFFHTCHCKAAGCWPRQGQSHEGGHLPRSRRTHCARCITAASTSPSTRPSTQALGWIVSEEETIMLLLLLLLLFVSFSFFSMLLLQEQSQHILKSGLFTGIREWTGCRPPKNRRDGSSTSRKNPVPSRFSWGHVGDTVL